jgi:dynein heavy chain, axonemal
LQTLKEVLGAIQLIKSESAETQLRFLELGERFRTRLLSCKAGLRGQHQQEYDECLKMHDLWSALAAEAVQMNVALEDARLEFSDITKHQVEAFCVKVRSFYDSFQCEGPGKANTNLAAGVKSMREVENDLADMLRERDELVLAQKLFNMNVTPYPELSKVRLLISVLLSNSAS